MNKRKIKECMNENIKILEYQGGWDVKIHNDIKMILIGKIVKNIVF